jgi:predicted DNA-binding transcriptional regulator AlpA
MTGFARGRLAVIPRRMVEPSDLAGLAEVAEILGASRRTAIRWAKRRDFPEPITRLRATPVWLRSEVEQWREEHVTASPEGFLYAS